MKIPKNFSAWWAESEEGKTVIAKGAADEVSERTASVTKIAELREALEKDVGPARKGLEKERDVVAKAREALTAAEVKLEGAQTVVHNLTHRAETEIVRLEQSLRDGCIPGIAPFIDELRNLWDSERKNWSWTHPDDSESAGLRIEQIRQVTAQAEALMFEPDPEVAERDLARLKAEIAQSTAVAA